MNKKDFDRSLINLFNQEIDGLSYEEKILLINEKFEKYQIQQYKNDENGEKIDLSNRGKPWTDSDLKLVLSDAPTRKNALKHAKFFKRGCGSILQIYRWAHMPKKAVKSKRSQDAFIAQIARVAKEIGSV